MSIMKRCRNDHFVDRKSATCPICPLQDDAIAATSVFRRSTASADENDATVAPSVARRDLDPVVGWLVCIAGPDRGWDYRIRSERNRIGRSPSMEIVIARDLSISRDTHAIVRYDPRTRRFRLLSGPGRSLVYRNGEVVDVAADLGAGDIVGLGRSELLFMPLCGPGFTWARPEPMPDAAGCGAV